MRIRKSAARLLGSAYGASAAATQFGILTPPPPPPPPPYLAQCPAPLESRGGVGLSSPETASGESCELSRSPWDLIAELSLSDPQVEDDLVDRYFVHVTTRASWLFSASMPVSSAKKVAAAARERAKRRRDAARRALKRAAALKEKCEASNKAKVKKEEAEEVPARVWKCKKNDGKRWHCHRTVSQPNTLCNYHFVQKRSYMNPDFEFASAVEPEEVAPPPPPPPPPAAASKPSSTNKSRKKKPTSDFIATEGFYYYAGFGPFRSKRQCRTGGGMNEPVPAKQEEEEEVHEEASPPPAAEDASPPAAAADQAPQTAEDTNRAAAPRDDVSSCDDDLAGIAGVDEDSSDDDYDGIGIPGSSNGDSKRKTPWKRWRKPVKARSLKSLM